jgi:hypothetical protein
MEAIMDKIMSTRMDEAVIRHIGMVAKKLGTSKKAILENAVRHYAEKIETEKDFDVLTDTFGIWIHWINFSGIAKVRHDFHQVK